MDDPLASVADELMEEMWLWLWLWLWLVEELLIDTASVKVMYDDKKLNKNEIMLPNKEMVDLGLVTVTVFLFSIFWVIPSYT